uniref:ATP-binding protein n=1 Tax=Ignavibacterium album TaxID=591197 RepID=A0A832D0M4_9BACT
MLIKRDFYIEKLKIFLDKPVIKVITGMRRVGKSTILLSLMEELKQNLDEKNIIYINKESLEFDFIQNYESLYKYIKSLLPNNREKKYVIIDEIQEILHWEKAILSIYTEKLADIIITGSNAHLLSSEIATLISGRYIEFQIYPLTFSEFLTFRGNNTSSKEDEFQKFIKFGGLPGIHLFNNDMAILDYLNSIINTLLLKDVVKRNNIRDVRLLEKIAQYLADNCGNITTAKSISDYFKSQKIKVSFDTVNNYISYLVSAFLFYRIQRFEIKGKKYLEFFDKIYLGDVGLRNGFIGYRDKDISGILENIVLLELKKRGYKVSVGVQNGFEIDFIAENQNGKIYFQVCRSLAEEQTIKREFGNLQKIDDNYKKIVLSLDKFFPEDYNGIEHQYLLDFLLQK